MIEALRAIAGARIAVRAVEVGFVGARLCRDSNRCREIEGLALYFPDSKSQRWVIS
jgi:hypothetical protein